MGHAMPKKIAVAFVHGIEVDDRDYAATAIGLLRRRFAQQAGVDADATLVVRAAYWSDVVRTREKKLLYDVLGSDGDGFFERLRWLVTKMNAGFQSALVPFGLAALARALPGLGNLHYPALRWVMTDFIGDVVAYQITPGERRVYDEIHGKIADTLRELADAAGPDAPLCVVAHSLGTVIGSNYLYDLQAERAGAKDLLPHTVHARRKRTPLELGETLAHFYTLGSPLALWALRYPDFGTPIAVPAPVLGRHHPGLEGEWVNFYDQDDLIGYPLRDLGPKYARAVTADVAVRIRGLLVSWNPLVHPWYWNDTRVIDPIAAALARTWRHVNQTDAAAARTETA
jgi:hypothetical protein